MTFTAEEKPLRGTRGLRRVQKKVVQESQPLEDTPLGNDARKRRVSALVMWYLPVTDRLRRIFLNPKEATLMTWWDDTMSQAEAWESTLWILRMLYDE
jgi:hypothetical protein